MLYVVINCERHKDRLERFKKHAFKSGLLNVHVQPCVDAKQWTFSDICKLEKGNILVRRTTAPGYSQEDFRISEVAISLSHIECWKKLVSSNEEFMCVFEDDVMMKPNFNKYVGKIMEQLPSLLNKNSRTRQVTFDIIHLVNGNWAKTHKYYQPDKTYDIQTGNKSFKLFRENKQYNAGAGCYIIRKAFAKALLEKVYPIRKPIDNFIGDVGFTKYVHLVVKFKEIGKTDTNPNPKFFDSPLVKVDIPYMDSKKSTHQTDSKSKAGKMKYVPCTPREISKSKRESNSKHKSNFKHA